MRNRANLSPMNLTVRKPMTLAEFLAWEERQEQRYEFDWFRTRRNGRRKPRPFRHPTQSCDGARNPIAGKPCHSSAATQDPGGGKQQSLPDGMVICSGLDPALKIVRKSRRDLRGLSPSTAAADRIVKARGISGDALGPALCHA